MSAERQRRYRERQRSPRRPRMVLPIEVDRFGLVDALQNACRLAEAQANDRDAIAEATATILEEWIFSVTRDAKDVPVGRKITPRR